MAEQINRLKTLDNPSKKDLFVLLIYLVFAGIYFFPIFFLGKSLLIDTLDHFITYIRMVERANWLSQGIVPLWDPKTFSGLSFINSVPTTHLLNLQAWVMAVFGDHLGYNLVVFAFVVLGAFGTYLFCQRRLRIDWRLSACAGISVAFGPYIGNTYSSIFAGFPFMSYFLYYFWVVFEERKMMPIVRAALYSALPLALCFYTQEPRYLEHIFYSTVLLIMIAIIIFGDERIKLIRNFIIFCVVSAVSFILLIIPILFPLILETVFTQQRLGSGEFLPPFLQYPNLSILLNIALGNFFPINLAVLHDGIRVFCFGSRLTFYFEYIHILFYGAMVLGITMYRRLRPPEQCLFWMPVVLMAVIYMAESVPGIMYFWTLVFKTGRFGLASNTSNFYGVVVVFLVLDKIYAGGLHNVQGGAATLARMIFTGQIVVAIMALAAVGFIAFFGQSFLFPYVRTHAAGLVGTTKDIDLQTIDVVFQAIYSSFLQRVPFLILGFLLLAGQIWMVRHAVLLGQRQKLSIPRSLLILLFVTPMLLSAAYWPFNNIVDRTDVKTADRRFLSSLSPLDRVNSVDLYKCTNLTPELRAQIFSVYSPKSLKWAIGAFPPAVVDFVHHFIPKDMCAYFRHMYAENYDFSHAIKYNPRFFFFPEDNNLFHLLGVNYILSELPLFSYPFLPMRKADDYYIYNNVKAFPRFYFVNKVTMINNDDKLIDTLRTMPYNDLRREAFIVSQSISNRSKSKTFCNDERLVSIISYTPNLVTLHTQSSHEQFLVFTDTFDQRWKVFIDGQQTELYKTNFLFRGVNIPPGSHHLKFIYSYPEFTIYILISLSALLGIFFFCKYTE